MQSKWRILLLAIVIAALVAGCGDDGGKKDNDEPGEANVPSESSGPDDEQPAAETDALPQTHTSASGLTLRYPAGWFAGDQGTDQVLMASNQVAFENPNEDSVALIINAPQLVRRMSVADSLDGWLADHVVSQTSERQITRAGAVETLTVGGRDAARVSVSRDDSDPSRGVAMEGFYLLVDLGDGNRVNIDVLALPGRLSAFEAQALAIAASISYTAP